ncbi:unnamed protein product [Peniophora sp. CBMAI 1063]|nr:unnamed protein product [Peniophora sp. CBMAI 1063]
MGAVDPTYPLYPIACILAAAALFLVLLSAFIRRNWNLGVAFLSLWLFLENIANGVDAIVWSDNAEVRLYAYCDLVSRLKVAAYIGRPLATFIITRRLFLIASLRSVKLLSDTSRRRASIIEWVLGLLVPLVIAGPVYYVHQGSRFGVQEGFGCSDVLQTSILEILTIRSWTLIPPFVSVVFYYPLSLRVFYRRSRDLHAFLQSSESDSRTNYARILALASIDLVLALPINITITVLNLTSSVAHNGSLPFYQGWTSIHDWTSPSSYSYANLIASGTSDVVQFYFTYWTRPIVAFVIFGLFGLTSEARASYGRVIYIIGGWLGWKPPPRTREDSGRSSLGEIVFDIRAQHSPLSDVEMGPGPHSPGLLTLVTPVINITKQDAVHIANKNTLRDPDPESMGSMRAENDSTVECRMSVAPVHALAR